MSKLSQPNHNSHNLLPKLTANDDINTQSTVETNVDANYVVKNDFELQSITSQASGKTNLSSTCSPQGFSQSELENNLEVSQKAPKETRHEQFSFRRGPVTPSSR